jgi:hypothetical protein
MAINFFKNSNIFDSFVKYFYELEQSLLIKK